jgi:FPC/CPF motif-containing protein YcgG
MNFKQVYDFTMHPVQDFSGGGCVDYVVAFSPPEEMKVFEEKNVEEEFERLKKLRTQMDGICSSPCPVEPRIPMQ